jgi:hypothetical protein
MFLHIKAIKINVSNVRLDRYTLNERTLQLL